MIESCRLRRDEGYEVRADEGASRAFVRRCRSQAAAKGGNMGRSPNPLFYNRRSHEQGYPINDPAHAGAI